MAEVVLVKFLVGLVSYTVVLVEESFRVPGSRRPGRLATWIEGTPELELNLSLVAEAFLQLLASGLGTLALVWATVVLLGGYSTALVRTDFWFTTAIVFVETARIVGYNSAPEAKFFVDVPAAFYQLERNLRFATATNIVRVLAIGSTWIALAPILIEAACMCLSIFRLAGIIGGRRHDYGGSSSGNLKPALILFYALVLAQGALFLLWLAVALNRMASAQTVRSRYMENEMVLSISEEEATKLIDRYVSSIEDTCIQKGVSGTINITLVSFAAELLLQSEHPDDHLSAVSVLHSLVINDEERSGRAVEQICSSDKLVYKLIRMLRSEVLDADIKVYIAKIIVELACKLRLADIPGAAHCISSLLDSRFIMMKNAGQTGRRDATNPQPLGVNQRSVDIDSRGEIKPLFVHGLVILRKFAADPANCTEIYNTMGLVPRIIAPVSNGLHMVIKNDETAVEIVRESLRVLAKLTGGTGGESGRKLCHELTTTKQGSRTADNILWILSNSSDQEMRMLAVEILSRLTLDEPIMPRFFAELQRLFFDPQDSPLRIEAGKALIARGHEFPDIQQLVTIVSAHGYSTEYRTVTAEMLAQICARFEEGQDRDRLSAVTNSLPSVLNAIVVTETRSITELDMSNRKFLASFLDLAVHIREKLVTSEAFADAVTGLPMGGNTFAEKLETIIEVTNDREDEICLAIMKSATKLVTWMTEIDTSISPGDYIEYFKQVNIVQKLDAAVEAMVELEMYVIMTGSGVDEEEGYMTLRKLVETAKNNLVPEQQQQN